jgi:tryptophanyl-tRNA synthetase
LTREVARRFNQIYCGVSDQAEDDDHVKLGGVFPVPHADVGKVGRLVGIDGVNKMSKSLNNAVFISDDEKAIKKKIGQIFTGRQSLTEKGDTNNALFQYVRIFITDQARIAELERKYAEGDNIGDGHVKAEVADAVNKLLAPMRERRKQYESSDQPILKILKEGSERAIATTEKTLALAKEAAGCGFFPRSVRYV